MAKKSKNRILAKNQIFHFWNKGSSAGCIAYVVMGRRRGTPLPKYFKAGMVLHDAAPT